jgi:nucleoside-diphosphate-sugar epimerase
MKMINNLKTVLVTGGAGYVGAVLIPKLLDKGYKVKVLDLFLYGDDVFDKHKANPNLIQLKGDIRDQVLLKKELELVDAVIHLACISNDPSYELNPDLGKSINFDAFLPLVQISAQKGVKRFIYASSSSVYGVKEEPEVNEELPLTPLTDYSKFKALCEDILLKEATDDMTCLILRPATVCGYSPRLRLDLTVNILTNFAVNKGEIQVFGGDQKRPNIHIEDMTDLYIQSLEWPHEKIHKKIFNAGYENFTVNQLAEIVREKIGNQVVVKHVPTNDNRSYHISSKKIADELGFTPKHSIADAVTDLKNAFDEGLIPNSFEEPRYFNIKMMQRTSLT